MDDRKIRLLFVDDEEKFLKSTATRLSLRGIDVQSFTNGSDALSVAESERFDVALIDLKMPGMDGEQLLKELKVRHPHMEVVILTGHGSFNSAVKCTKDGAYEYLQKPCSFDELISVLSKAYAKKIQANKSSKAAKVDEVLRSAIVYSPLALLEKLKEIDAED